MAYSDLDRRNLFDAATKALGDGPATTLMDLLPPAGWSDLVRQSDLLAVKSDLKADIAEVRTEVADLRTELKVEIASVRTELKVEIASVRTELTVQITDLRSEMRSEFSKVRLEMSNMQARLIATNFGAMVGLAGLVMAAAKLL